jgi:K+-transporting ATPase ATPase C chain
MAMSGSNMARTNPDLRKRIAAARAEIAVREGIDASSVPGDLLTQSGSGIDPQISVAAARIQIARVAKARGLDAAKVAALVAQNTEGAQFGLFGPPRVNVLELNLALDALSAGSGAK